MADGCSFTLWKDCLVRGGGPELNEKLLRMLLEQKQLRGSTGTIVLGTEAIAFWPPNAVRPSAERSLKYVRNR